MAETHRLWNPNLKISVNVISSTENLNLQLTFWSPREAERGLESIARLLLELVMHLQKLLDG